MVDYLNNQGVKDIKYLIATHSHADHLGGLDSVVKNFNIENVFCIEWFSRNKEL